jgi:hypothetical protein
MDFYNIYKLSHPEAQNDNHRAYLLSKQNIPVSMLLDFQKIYDDAQKLKLERSISQAQNQGFLNTCL